MHEKPLPVWEALVSVLQMPTCVLPVYFVFRRPSFCVVLLQPPECWDVSCEPLSSAVDMGFFFFFKFSEIGFLWVALAILELSL